MQLAHLYLALAYYVETPASGVDDWIRKQRGTARLAQVYPSLAALANTAKAA